MPRGENLAADRPRKARAGKTASKLGDFADPSQLVRLKAVRDFIAEVMVDPETASKDRPPLSRAFMDVDAKVVALEEEENNTAKVTPLSPVAKTSKAFDASRFA